MPPVLLTCGATRNPVDAIRYLSAHATGRTAVELVALLPEPAPVHLLGSAEALLRAQAVLGGREGLTTEEFFGTRDLEARVRRWVEAHPDGIVVHSAAVGDYELAALGTKIPSGQAEVLLRLTPAPKILDQVRGWGLRGLLVSFKAGSPELDEAGLVDVARRQLLRTGSDLVFANVLGRLGSSVVLVEAAGEAPFPRREDAVAALAARVRAAQAAGG